MKSERTTLLSILPLISLITQAQAARVTSVIKDIPDNKGTVFVALCHKSAFPKGNCAFHQRVTAQTPSISVTFKHVLPGTFAIKTFVDENHNGRLDRSFWGVPSEPIGFSLNPRLKLHAPRFDDCAFTVDERDITLTINLKSK